jgi:FtsP/CotA-like multicopper oxidase with cupredoxin domain
VSRRLKRILLWSLAVVVFAALALTVGTYALYARADVSTVGKLDFATALRIPPLLEPRVDGDGRKVFGLRLQAGEVELLPGETTETWGANGAYLGPTIRAARGDRVVLRVDNRLSEVTTLHWHGMHLPSTMDGNPHQPIPPGTTWSPSWRIDQQAATLWYHPHLMGATAEHVYRGIAGMFILDDPDADELPLPGTYAVDDIPVILQDKRFEADGALDLTNRLISPIGLLGSDILVNGTYDPYLNVTTERVRLRLLNASNGRIYNVGFSDDRTFHLIATDGGLLETSHRTTRIQLSPGERAEIVAEFEPGERVILRSDEPDLGTNFWEERFTGGDDSFDLLQLRAADELAFTPDVPLRLVAHRPLRAEDAVKTRRFELGGQGSINGKSMDMSRIDEVVTVDTTEIWEVENTSGTPHNFHPHDIRFKILDYQGTAPPEQLAGWKDTVYLPPGKNVRLVTGFSDYTDPDVPYMFHCHVLQHEDRGMMGQFVVVEPGQAAGRPPDNYPPAHGHS